MIFIVNFRISRLSTLLIMEHSVKQVICIWHIPYKFYSWLPDMSTKKTVFPNKLMIIAALVVGIITNVDTCSSINWLIVNYKYVFVTMNITVTMNFDRTRWWRTVAVAIVDLLLRRLLPFASRSPLWRNESVVSFQHKGRIFWPGKVIMPVGPLHNDWCWNVVYI